MIRAGMLEKIYGKPISISLVKWYRQQGLGKWLVECILNHPELQGLRRWMLATKDAHDLYRRYGFTPLEHPEKLMELPAEEHQSGHNSA